MVGLGLPVDLGAHFLKKSGINMEKEVKKIFGGEKSRQLLDEFRRYVIMEPQPFVLELSKCSGMWLYTVDDQKIFDWSGYYGSKLLGHNRPEMSEPEYLKRLALAANNKVANPDFLTQECIEYYRLLHELAPKCMAREGLEVYAVNSGAEAVENMMKYMINLYDKKMISKKLTPGVRRFIYFDRAFHGRTIFALNVTELDHDPAITKDFKGFLPGNMRVPFPSFDSSQGTEWNKDRMQRSLELIEDCLKRYKDEVVGIIIEPIQGAGGHRIAMPEFYRSLSRLINKYDVFLGVDEVQTAGGQTGTVFAIDQFNLPYPPQAVAVAKKFGNGVVYMLKSMEDLGVLDSTWGGSLADMVRVVQEFKIVRREKLIEQVPEKAKVLVDGLNELAERYKDLIFNVRGMGLYQGFTVRVTENRGRLKEIALYQENMLLLGGGVQSIRFRPVLDVTIDDIKLMLEKLDRCLKTLRLAK